MITYKTIGVTEKETALAAFIKAQETDHMHFSINLERFRAIRDTYEDTGSDYYKRYGISPGCGVGGQSRQRGSTTYFKLC